MSEPRIDGSARLSLAGRAGRTVLAGLFQQGSLRVFRPRPAPGDIANVVLLNTSGGLVGGDRLEVRAEIGPGAAAVITSQAAEKVYRSLGRDAAFDAHLDLVGNAWLEWLPQETILFDGARLRRALRIDLAPEARLIAGDILVFGRRARGERFRSGCLVDRWEVRIGGRLVWADVLRLDGVESQIEAPFGFAGAGACAAWIYVASDAGRWLELARHLADRPGVRAGATLIGPVLIVRWLAADPAALTGAVQHYCARFRHAVRGLPARAPAIWSS
ncbi:MAG TPA: urease accessory protein UreD [Geminicoccaceae bacterium]